MSPPLMRWPIRYQLMVPSAAVLVVALTAIAITGAFLSARRSEERARGNLQAVVEALARAPFPLTQNVLERMHGLSGGGAGGAEFVALDASGKVLASTLSAESQAAWPAIEGSLNSQRTVTIGGRRFDFASIAPAQPNAAAKLVVLTPEQGFSDVGRDAAIAPLAVGGAALGLLLAVGWWQARRFGKQIEIVHGRVAAIAAGDFREAPAAGADDEFEDLIGAVNAMSQELAAMRRRIHAGEREFMLSRLALGLAHQLRNAITGARMAIQIHQGKCPARENEAALSVALKQLGLVEQQVKALLTLGKRRPHSAAPFDPSAAIQEVADLVSPYADHHRVSIKSESADSRRPRVYAADREAVIGAVLNLALNAIEAAGAGGEVRLRLLDRDRSFIVEVSDTGPGPSAELATTLFDPFVTGKPEGVGLGLALAKRVAEEHGGTLAWRRDESRTIFSLEAGLTR